MVNIIYSRLYTIGMVICILTLAANIHRIKAQSNAPTEPTEMKRSNSIFQAAREGDLALLQAFIDSGVSVNHRGNDGGTPLMSAADAGQDEAVDWLLNHGADVNAVDEFGTTALMCAVTFGHVNTVKLLLMRGADAHIKSRLHAVPDETAIDIALRRGHMEIVDLLRSW